MEIVTDYVAAGSFKEISKHVHYLRNKDFAQLIRTVDLKSNFKAPNEVFVDQEAFDFLWRVHLDRTAIVLPNVGNCGESYYIEPTMFPYKNNVLGPNAILVASNRDNNKYLSLLFQTKSFQQELKLIISPSGQTKFNKTEFKKIKVEIPSLPEQQKIADFFTTLDRRIALSDKKLSTLQTIKKGMLQKIFSQELRFKDDDGNEFPAWKEVVMGDIARFINGRAYSSDELLSHGKYRVLRVGNFFTNDEWYYSDMELENEKYAENGDLLYAWSATFGPRIWDGEKVIFHYHIWKVIPENFVTKEFLYVLLSVETDKMHNMVNGGTMTHITKGTIEKWKTSIPSLPEQQKISAYFTAFDRSIVAAQRKAAALRTIKKGLLQKMFI